MDTADILARIRYERQILALLDHPKIARLIDGATTAEGMPYFVMEYVEGERIDRYSNSGRLSTCERLQLFQAV
jgi:serine/threonine protein kinase